MVLIDKWSLFEGYFVCFLFYQGMVIEVIQPFIYMVVFIRRWPFIQILLYLKSVKYLLNYLKNWFYFIYFSSEISQCPYGTYKCNNSLLCLKPHRLCDGHIDCVDDGGNDDHDDESTQMCGDGKLHILLTWKSPSG